MTRANSGVSAYMTNLAVATVFGANANLDGCSPMLKWYLHETAKDTFSAGVETQLTDAIDYCHAHGKFIILRTSAGIDSPIGKPAGGQASWLTGRGVDRIRTLQTDPTPSLYGLEAFVPDVVTPASRDQYVADLADWFTRLGTILSANDVGGHPRWNHVSFVTVPGPEQGTEMSLGAGALGDTVYSGAATLGTALGTGAITHLTLAGPYSAYPTGPAILLIGSERFHQTSRSGATATIGKRGHSGSVAASHLAGATVKYASAKITDTRFDGYPASGTAPFDHRAVDYAAWATLGSQPTYIAGVAQYWLDATAAIAAALPSEVRVSVAGGQVFGDWGPANDNLEVWGPALTDRFVGGVTNFVDDYPTSNPNEDAWLARCVELGCPIFTQTAGVTRLGEPPTAGALQRLVKAGEDALARGTWVFETGLRRFANTTTQATTAYGDWPGGFTTERGYLVDAP